MGDAITPLAPAWPAPQLQQEPDRLLANYEAEQGLIGAILANNAALDRIPPEFRPDHFSDPLHARVFLAVREMVDAGETCAPHRLRRFFDGEEATPGVPVITYLVGLVRGLQGIVNAEDWARTITDVWARRATVDTCRAIIAGATVPELSGEDVLEAAEASIRALTDHSTGARGLVPIGNCVDDVLAQIERARRSGGVSGLSTGMVDLDRKTAGLHPGSFVVIGARPGMGKSDLALNIAINAALAGKHVGFFSLEMSRDLLTNRALGRLTGIPATNQISGLVDDEQIAPLVRAGGDLRAMPLHIDDGAAASVDVIGTRARKMQRRHGLDLVVVDYLQIIAAGNSRRNREANRTTDVTMISQGLKALAKGLHVPLIALCQLSRAVEAREDKRPTMADLRESGSIEQDADVVMFVYRDSYYLDRDQPKQREHEKAADFNQRRSEHEQKTIKAMNVCDILIPKQRMGPPTGCVLYYNPAQSHFGDMDPRDDDGGGR